MKVMFITAATFTIPWFREDMLKEFTRRADEVVVLGNEPLDKWSEYFEAIGVRYIPYNVSRNGLSPVEDLKTYRELHDLIVAEKPDKVLTNFVKANVYGCIAAHRAGIEDIFVMMGGLGSVFHGDDTKSKLARKFVVAGYRASLKYAKKIFFQNDEDSNLLVSLRLVERDQVVRINGSGVNTEHFPQRPLPDKPSFVFIGRLVRGKGVMEYLEAAKMVKREYPEAEFNLVGPYDTNPSALKSEDIQPYIDNGTVVYHGEQKDVRPYLEAASVFVLPSYYGEGTPKSALEAMSTGRPLIVADAVGCREVVEDDLNGYLVEPKSVSALVDAMCKMISKDDDSIATMGKASRGMAMECFDVRKVNATLCGSMGVGNPAGVNSVSTPFFICSKNSKSFQGPNIEKAGFEVVAPFRGNDERLLIRALRELCFRLHLPVKEIWNNPEVKKMKERTAIIFDSSVNPSYLEWLRKELPTNRLLLCYSNKVRRDIYLTASKFGYEQWSFDRDDCARLEGLNHNAYGYYFDHLTTSAVCCKSIDLLYIGRDKGRAGIIFRLASYCKANGIRFEYRIVPDHRYELWKKPYYQPAVPYSEIVNANAKTKAILAFAEGAQSAITIRALESVFNGIKLVTTDAGARDYFFYDKDRVFILGEDPVESLPSFLETPFPPIEQEALEEWNFTRWVERLMGDNRNCGAIQ